MGVGVGLVGSGRCEKEGWGAQNRPPCGGWKLEALDGSSNSRKVLPSAHLAPPAQWRWQRPGHCRQSGRLGSQCHQSPAAWIGGAGRNWGAYGRSLAAIASPRILFAGLAQATRCKVGRLLQQQHWRGRPESQGPYLAEGSCNSSGICAILCDRKRRGLRQLLGQVCSRRQRGSGGDGQCVASGGGVGDHLSSAVNVAGGQRSCVWDAKVGELGSALQARQARHEGRVEGWSLLHDSTPAAGVPDRMQPAMMPNSLHERLLARGQHTHPRCLGPQPQLDCCWWEARTLRIGGCGRKRDW